MPSVLLPNTPDDSFPYLALQAALVLAAAAIALSTARVRSGFRCLHDVLSGTRVVPAPHSTRRRVAPAPVSHGSRPADLPEWVGSFPVRDERWRQGEDRVLGSADPGLDRPVWLWLRPASRPGLPEARRVVDRATRLRWLAQGEEEGRRWDAFLAPAGSSLLDAVRSGGVLDWPEAREALEALADELIQAHREGSLPEGLSLSSIWVLPGGGVLLLDMPGPGDESVSALDLLAEAALLLLQGDPAARRLPRRPLPIHVRELLAELPRFGGRLRDLETFRDHLRATRERPAEVSRPLRLLHLGILLAAQTLCCASWLPLIFSGGMATLDLGLTLEQAERLEADLDRATAAGAAGLAAPTLHPTTRWTAPALWVHWEANVRLSSSVEPARDYYRARRGQLLFRRLRLRELPGERTLFTRSPLPGPLLDDADKLAEKLEEDISASIWVAISFLTMSAAAFLLCLASALAFRGGLRYRMLGLCVVCRTGRPAGRLRCAWRTLLAWLICVAPLALARVFEELYWSSWDSANPPAWLLTLADLGWLLAGVLLAAWLIVVLRTPARSLHDRLAGTWLVPR